MALNYLKFRHPFTCMVSGPTSSGKTILIRRILRSFKLLIEFKEDVKTLKVLWTYGQWQPLYEKPIGKHVKVKYVYGFPSEEEILEDKPHIIIIDDLMTEIGGNVNFANLITRGSHHMNISVIFVTQNLYHKGPHMRTVSLNCHYYILMGSLRSKGQLRHLASETFPGQLKYVMEAFEDATKEKPYSYIRLDMTQKTPDKYRISSRITPEEAYDTRLDIAPVFYIPR